MFGWEEHADYVGGIDDMSERYAGEGEALGPDGWPINDGEDYGRDEP